MFRSAGQQLPASLRTLRPQPAVQAFGSCVSNADGPNSDLDLSLDGFFELDGGETISMVRFPVCCSPRRRCTCDSAMPRCPQSPLCCSVCWLAPCDSMLRFWFSNRGLVQAEAPKAWRQKILRAMSRKLKSTTQDQVFIMHARVPVVKLVESNTLVDCDLCVCNRSGVFKSHVFRAVSEIDPRFPELVRLVCPFSLPCVDHSLRQTGAPCSFMGLQGRTDQQQRP